ncbi:MAG: hypothetical protein KAR32_12870 [Candidatus Omnitrophica bacterium]|nr:hypothetical protein [Candidatus Omnitrophota bacterium]
MTKELKSISTETKEYYETLKIDVLWLHGRWKIYRQLFMKSEQRISLLNECAGGVFNIMKFAQLDDFTLTLCRLTDPLKSAGKETLSLRRLIESLRKDSNENIIIDLEKHFKELQEKCIPFRDHRNQRVAHKDLSISRKIDPEPLPGISVKKIEDALSKLRHFMECFEYYFIESSPAYNNVDIGFDEETLINVLKQSITFKDLSKKDIKLKQAFLNNRYKDA